MLCKIKAQEPDCHKRPDYNPYVGKIIAFKSFSGLVFKPKRERTLRPDIFPALSLFRMNQYRNNDRRYKVTPDHGMNAQFLNKQATLTECTCSKSHPLISMIVQSLIPRIGIGEKEKEEGVQERDLTYSTET